jgi:hypothetical protein
MTWHAQLDLVMKAMVIDIELVTFITISIMINIFLMRRRLGVTEVCGISNMMSCQAGPRFQRFQQPAVVVVTFITQKKSVKNEIKAFSNSKADCQKI